MSVLRTLRNVRGPRRAGPGRSERVRLLLLLGTAAAILAAAPAAAYGQAAPPPSLGQLRDEVEAAQRTYEAALAVMNLERNELAEVLREIPESRSSDVRAWEEGRTRYLVASREADESEDRVRRTKETLDSVEARLADRLVERRDSLEVELVDAPPGEAAGLRARIRDLNFEIRELRPPPQEPSVVFAFRAPVAYDRRDGPEQIRGKIQIAERQLEEQDSSIAYWQRQIDQLEERIRAEQRLGDFESGLDRFGDMRPPTVSNPARGDDPPANLPTDSTAAQTSPATPEELLEGYRSILNSTRRYREAIAESLAELRVVLGRIGAR